MPALPETGQADLKDIHILCVEDDPVELTHLQILLEKGGYHSFESVDNAVDALVAFNLNQPDLIVLDIHLKGDTDGIQLAKKFHAISPVPVIFLTSHNTVEKFQEARQTNPYAYLTKPVEPLTLQTSIELALQQAKGAPAAGQSVRSEEGSLTDAVFTKIGNKLKRIGIEHIQFIEVEGRYSSLVVDGRRYHLKISLRELLEKLPQDRFVRVSRNHVVQLAFIEDIDIQQFQLAIGEHVIPISRTYKDDLMGRINLI